MEEMPTGSTPYLFNVSLKLILENEEGKILGLRCRQDMNLAGFYDLPGGRINADEIRAPYAQTISRELGEELGMDFRYDLDPQPVAIGNYLHFSKRLQRESCNLMVFFRASYRGGEIRLSEEHEAYDWLDLRAAPPEKYFCDGFLDGIKGYLKSKANR